MEALVTVIVVVIVVISGIVNARNKRGEPDENEYSEDIDAAEQLKRVFSEPPATALAEEEPAEDDEVKDASDFEHTVRDENVWETKIAALKKKQAEAERLAQSIHHIAAAADSSVRSAARMRIDLTPNAVRQGIIYAAIFERKRPVFRARRR